MLNEKPLNLPLEEAMVLFTASVVNVLSLIPSGKSKSISNFLKMSILLIVLLLVKFSFLDLWIPFNYEYLFLWLFLISTR